MRIANVRDYGGVIAARAAGCIYVGRPSPLGNPYQIGQHGTRARVIELYAIWLDQKVADKDPAVLGALRKLSRDSVLACHCAPWACHAELIIKKWEQLYG